MTNRVIWLAVPGFASYEVSNDGRVRSIDRVIHYKDGRSHPFKGRQLKTFIVKDYEHLAFGIGGRKVNRYVHLLVCEAFHGPRPSPLHEARHLNGIETDNRASNLAWGTKSENAQDSIRLGRNKELNKTHCKYGHRFDRENTAITPKGSRGCRACRREHNRKYREAHREEINARERQRWAERKRTTTTNRKAA